MNESLEHYAVYDLEKTKPQTCSRDSGICRNKGKSLYIEQISLNYILDNFAFISLK